MTSYTGSVRDLTRFDEHSSIFTNTFWVGVFVLLSAFGALVRIPLPFTPVPVTMQTLAVLLAGVALGGRKGALSQGIYIAAGAAGLPIFAGMASGMAWLTGPTAGYLAGFLVAPAVVASVVGDSGDRIRLIAGFVAGTAVIFLLGVLWIAVTLGGGLSEALYLGLYPFIPGAVVKIGLAVVVTEGLRKLSERS